MRVVVIGATGGVGQQLLEQALFAGHEVRALVRNHKNVQRVHERLYVGEGDVVTGEGLAAVMKGARVVLSCLGSRDRGHPVVAAGTQKLLEAATAAGVKRLAFISAAGVGDSKAQAQRASFVFGRIIMPLFLGKIFGDLDAAEQAAVRWSAEHPLSVVRVRPAGLTNGKRVGRIITTGPDGDIPARISRADTAAFMLSLVEETSWDNKAVSIGGT